MRLWTHDLVTVVAFALLQIFSGTTANRRILVLNNDAGPPASLNFPESLQQSQDQEEIEVTTTMMPEALEDPKLSSSSPGKHKKRFEKLPVSNVRVEVVDVESGRIIETLSREGNSTVVIPVGKYLEEEMTGAALDIAKKVIRLGCDAKYPVEWIYQGYGTPFWQISKSTRHTSNYENSTTYTFSALLDFSKNEERNTGKYICRRTGVNTTIGSYIQLFAPGKNLFLPIKEKIMKISKNSSEFVIPCALTNSRASAFIRLYSVEKSGPVPMIYLTNYDPTSGFTVPVDYDDGSFSNKYNFRKTFFCKDVMTGQMSEEITVIFPTEKFVQVTPAKDFVKIVSGVKQVFICAAKQNVTLIFSGDRQPRIINFAINTESEFPYVASFEINPMTMNITSEHTVIKCVNGNGEVLHTWEYSTYEDVSLSKFYFDPRKRYQDARYVCCSKSFYKPKLEFTFCRTEVECLMKKLVFNLDPGTKEGLIGEYYDRVTYLNHSCVAFSPYLKYTLPSGMLRCSVQGINKEVHKDFMYYFNPYRVYQAYTDSRFNTSKVIKSESIMKLSKTPSKNVLVGERQRFLCYYSELFLSNGVMWSLHYANGSSVMLDKKYNTATHNSSFSQVELTFNDTSVQDIACHAPVKDSPTKWKIVKGAVFVRKHPSMRIILESVDNGVQQEVKYNTTEGLIIDNKLTDISNNSVYAEGNITAYVVLECNASFPVDFTYSGEGTPQIEYISKRIINGSLLEASSYSYSAKLRILKLDRNIVGKYSCVSATREFGHKGQSEDLEVSVKVFIPDEKRLFINKENQTFRAWEYRDSVLIPCTINDPRVNVTLQKFNNETRNFEEVTSPHPIPYDALHGFSLTKNHTESIFGLYKCVGQGNQSSGIIQIYLPSNMVKVKPYKKEVKVDRNESQIFQCQGKENVTLVFSDDPKNTMGRCIQYTTIPSSAYPYRATYNTEIGEFSNLTWINCTTTADSKSRHTWELFPRDGIYIDKFFFNNETLEMECCTKPYRSAVIEWINCSSVTECLLKQSACLTQNKCQPGDFVLTEGIDKSNLRNGCLPFDMKQRSQGLLKCVVKGVHKIVAQALVYYLNPGNGFEVHDGYFLNTKIFDKFDVRSSKIMKLESSIVDRNIERGEKVKFTCEGSKFFLGSSMLWALETLNGTLHYFKGQEIQMYENVHSEIAIEFDKTAWKSIYCIAPNWKEYYGWRNVSLDLRFQSPANDTPLLDTTTLPAFEGDAF